MTGKEEVAASKIGSDRLPEELTNFLSRDTYSLVVRGESGTGKTILALTILKTMNPSENLLYISTRTSPLQLLEYYPWIDSIFGPPKQLGDAQEEGWETLVDSRLDEPNTVFERVTNVLMDKQAPTVVIDSWEALSDTLGGEALRTNLRVLETWRERAGARFIFIGEDPANTALDYMVEGAVVLKERTDSGRRLREMEISKLHGIQIRRPSYFFSLDDGTFRCFPEYSPDDYVFRRPIPVKLDRPIRGGSGHISSGHAALDMALKGGFRPNSMAVVEVDADVDMRVGLVLLANLVWNWTSGGGAVLMQRPSGVSPSFVRQYSRSFASGKGGERLGVLGKGEKARHRVNRKQGSRVLVIASPPAEGRGDGVPPDYDQESGRPGLTVILARPGASLPAMEDATTRLRVSVVEGTLFVSGEVPWSPLLGIIPGTTAGNPIVQLEPVV
jgi:KaiC/GvpD/RAD55 family RecA-like ATPase